MGRRIRFALAEFLYLSPLHMWKHWVARALYPHEPFGEFESARWFWKKLGETFPEMISAVLMPNHLHLILPSDRGAGKKLAGLLGAMSIRCDLKKPWQPLPNPTEIPDSLHLRRQIRYLALNPCRKKLCNDPLEWYWSTYREVMGASVNSIQSGENLAVVLKDSQKDFAVRFHAYVSGDPSVSITGTPFPKLAAPKNFPEESIGEILAAAAGALRMKPSQVRERGQLRNLFVHLAYRHGWRRPIFLAYICGMTPGAVHQILNKDSPSGIKAAELCLGDPRLRQDENEGVMNFIRAIKSVDTKAWSRRFL